MRLYTGISLDPPVEEKLASMMDTLKPLADWKWSPRQNLHITTKFIGEWPESRLPELTAALADLGGRSPITIAVAGFGWFPDAARPKSLYAAVHGSAALAALARATDEALRPLGVAAEDHPYVPHVTLARIHDHNRCAPERKLPEHLAHMTDIQFGSFEATAFHLYQSTPGPRASVYSKLASFPLEVAA